jgi:hypothetical protein
VLHFSNGTRIVVGVVFYRAGVRGGCSPNPDTPARNLESFSLAWARESPPIEPT